MKFANFFPEFFRTRTLWSGLVVSHVFVVFASEILRREKKKYKFNLGNVPKMSMSRSNLRYILTYDAYFSGHLSQFFFDF